MGKLDTPEPVVWATSLWNKAIYLTFTLIPWQKLIGLRNVAEIFNYTFKVCSVNVAHYKGGPLVTTYFGCCRCATLRVPCRLSFWLLLMQSLHHWIMWIQSRVNLTILSDVQENKPHTDRTQTVSKPLPVNVDALPAFPNEALDAQHMQHTKCILLIPLHGGKKVKQSLYTPWRRLGGEEV